MRVSASIVTYHTPLDELKRAIEFARRSIIWRLYIIDNSRSEQIRELCEKARDIVKYIPSENLGYGAGHNKAMKDTWAFRTTYHIVMNSDIECPPEAVEKLADYLDEHLRVVSIQPRIVNEDGSLQYTVRRLPTPLDVFGRRFLPKWMMKKRNDRYLLRYIDHDRAFDVPYHQGSFMFFRADTWDYIDGFDTRFFMYPEDIDFTRRLHNLGRTIYWPGVTVVHRHRAASYHSLRMLWIHCVNMVRYFNKWGWWNDPDRDRLNGYLDRGFTFDPDK